MPSQVPFPRRELPVFVYGTLKEGFRNHERYCHGVIEVAPALAWGRFHEWEPGIPILSVPRDDVLLLGSRDAAADLEAAEQLVTRPGRALVWKRRLPWRWRCIRGQLLRFPDPEQRLRLLDALEGFHPATGRGYQRVLLPTLVHADDGTVREVRAAWAYVVPAGERPPGKPLRGVSWEAGRA
jgi:gamma-glutamylcyclotransferase (GGCT)/AIG2-like uncharacterized protein YtfP